jgi:creatinine amidohydrolase/Fe(II)-dependent formamide hydrolase-like protein
MRASAKPCRREDTVKLTRPIVIAWILVSSVALAAGQAAQQQGQGRGGRGQMTPEQREAAARRAYDEEAAKPRPIDALDSVWLEELTYMEVRDAMKAGKTTALVFAGSTEQNGPYLAGGKHQYAIRLVGEAIARTLGDALIAPVIPLEAGNPGNQFLQWGSLYLTADTFRAVVRDVATSLKGQGFAHIMLMGDSGGNTAGLRAVAEELSAAWGGTPSVHHIPEYYNWTSRGGVRQFVLDNGIPERINADGIHDEYGLTAVLMASDPKLVRYDQRKAAGKLTINGVDISDQSAVAAMGRKIVAFRAEAAVTAIRKARGR